MRLDVTQTLTEIDGKTKIRTSTQTCVVCGQPLDTGEDLTLRLALTRALSFRIPNKTLAFEEQMKRYYLAKRVQDNDVVELTTLEAGELQHLIAVIYTPVVTGPVGIALEGPSSDADLE